MISLEAAIDCCIVLYNNGTIEVIRFCLIYANICCNRILVIECAFHGL